MRWLDERRLFNEPERWVDANMERNAMLSWFWPRLAFWLAAPARK